MIPLRLAQELTDQLERAQAFERLARALASGPVLLSLYEDEHSTEVLEYWQELTKKGFEPEGYYRASLAELRSRNSALLPEALLILQSFFEVRSQWNFSVELLTELLSWAERQRDERMAMKAHRGLGSVTRHQGEFARAVMHSEKSLEIAEALNDAGSIALAIGNIGVTHIYKGQFDEAYRCFQKHYALAESFGDKRGMEVSISNMAFIHSHEGRADDAIACCEQAIALAEALGNIRGVASATGNLGLIHAESGRFEKAIACYSQSLELSASINNKSGMMNALGNLGITFRQQGRFVEAMRCHQRNYELAKEIGNLASQHSAAGNIASVYFEEGRYLDAFEWYHQAFLGHNDIGFVQHSDEWHFGLADTLLNIAIEEVSHSDYLVEFLRGRREEIDPDSELSSIDMTLQSARHHAEACHEVTVEHSKHENTFAARVLLARIDAAEGNITLATEKLGVMLAEAAEAEQTAELHYWLWKISKDIVSKDVARRIFKSLWSGIPKFEYRRRIAELKGERIRCLQMNWRSRNPLQAWQVLPGRPHLRRRSP